MLDVERPRRLRALTEFVDVEKCLLEVAARGPEERWRMPPALRLHLLREGGLADAEHELPSLVECHCATLRQFVAQTVSADEERAYGYALEHAAVALPAAAAAACVGEQPNCSSQAAANRDIWLSNTATLAGLSSAPDAVSALEACVDSFERTCRGFVVFMHGSNGTGGASLRLVRALAGSGFAVLVPESMANGRARERPRRPPAEAAAAAAADYWASDPLYMPGSIAKGRLTYSTRPNEVLARPLRYKKLYADVHKLRASELAHVLRRLPERIRHGRGVLLAGYSEGAMAAARLPIELCQPPVRVLGLALCAWGCERCYFAPCGCCQLSADSAPVLCVLGTSDPYFSTAPSSCASLIGEALWAGEGACAAAAPAADTADGAGEAGPSPASIVNQAGWHLTGSPLSTVQRSAVPSAFVALLHGAAHDVTRTHDRCVRALLATFCAAPDEAHALLDRLDNDAQKAVRPSENSIAASATARGHVTVATLESDEDARVGARAWAAPRWLGRSLRLDRLAVSTAAAFRSTTTIASEAGARLAPLVEAVPLPGAGAMASAMASGGGERAPETG